MLAEAAEYNGDYRRSVGSYSRTLESATWRVVADIAITQLPIYILSAKSNGWHNIGVWLEGGGIQSGYEAELRFDGKSYPDNPSVPPARPIVGKAKGELIVASTQNALPLHAVHTH